MYQYTCDPECEIYGGLLTQLHTHINYDDVESIVKRQGLGAIDADKWYPLQRLFDVFNEVTKASGAMLNFVSIGMAVAEHALLPPEMEDATQTNFWELWAGGYFYNHRNGNIGKLDIEFPEPKHVRVTDSTLYPSDHIYGVIYGFTKRFNPAKAFFTVKYDETPIRKESGGGVTVFHIYW